MLPGPDKKEGRILGHIPSHLSASQQVRLRGKGLCSHEFSLTEDELVCKEHTQKPHGLWFSSAIWEKSLPGSRHPLAGQMEDKAQGLQAHQEGCSLAVGTWTERLVEHRIQAAVPFPPACDMSMRKRRELLAGTTLEAWAAC